jgi:hypothetical protein
MNGSAGDGTMPDGHLMETMISLTFVASINLLLTLFLSVAASATVG